MSSLRIPYHQTEAVPPYWQNWDASLKTQVFSPKQFYRVFGLYVERQQQDDPFRRLLQTYDIFRWISSDPAWENAMLRLALPESKTYVYQSETLHCAGHTYRARDNAPSLLPAGTRVSLRLSSCSTHYGWVYHAQKLLTNVFRSDTSPSFLHQFRDWEDSS